MLCTYISRKVRHYKLFLPLFDEPDDSPKEETERVGELEHEIAKLKQDRHRKSILRTVMS